MLYVQLKEHTRLDHVALEKKFLHRISKIRHAGDYVVMLSMLYPYYNAVENRLMHFFDTKDSTDFHNRRKAFKLRDDMATFTACEEDLEQCTHVPEVNSYYAALGVLYVLEGSTLGGPIIARLIASKLNKKIGLSFFLGYGEETAEMWKKFKSCLQQPFTPEQEAEIMNGARQTFTTFYYWLSAHD